MPFLKTSVNTPPLVCVNAMDTSHSCTTNVAICSRCAGCAEKKQLEERQDENARQTKRQRRSKGGGPSSSAEETLTRREKCCNHSKRKGFSVLTDMVWFTKENWKSKARATNLPTQCAICCKSLCQSWSKIKARRRRRRKNTSTAGWSLHNITLWTWKSKQWVCIIGMAVWLWWWYYEALLSPPPPQPSLFAWPAFVMYCNNDGLYQCPQKIE